MRRDRPHPKRCTVRRPLAERFVGLVAAGALLIVLTGCGSTFITRWVAGAGTTISTNEPTYRDWDEVTPPPMVSEAALTAPPTSVLDVVQPPQPVRLHDCVLAGLEHAWWDDGRPMILFAADGPEVGCPIDTSAGGIILLIPPRYPGGVAASMWRYRFNEVVGNVEKAYWDLYRAEALYRAADTALSQVQRLRDGVKRRVDAGAGTQQALLSAEVQLLALREQRLHARGDGDTPPGLLAAQAKLRELVGMPPQSTQRLSAVDGPTQEAVDLQWQRSIELVLSRHPALVATRDAIEEADLDVRVLENLGFKELQPEAAPGVRKTIRENVEQLYRLTDQALWKHSQVWRGIIETSELITLRSDQVAAVDQLVVATEQAYNAGQLELEELLDAQRQQVEMRTQLVMAQVDYRIAILEYHRMRGELLTRFGLSLITTSTWPPSYVPEPKVDPKNYWPIVGPERSPLPESSGIVIPASEPLPTSQSGERAIFSEQIFEGPALNNPATVEHVDPIRLSNRAQSVRDHDSRGLPTQERSGDVRLSPIVESAGGFIQDENAWLESQSASE
jgi:hypothetical protein